MIGVPFSSTGGVRNKQPCACSRANLCKVRVREVTVLADIQPFAGMGERGMRRMASDLQQLLLRCEDQRNRSVLSDQLLEDVVLESGSSGVRRAAVRVYQHIVSSIRN